MAIVSIAVIVVDVIPPVIIHNDFEYFEAYCRFTRTNFEPEIIFSENVKNPDPRKL